MKQEIELARPATDVKLRPYEHHAKYYETDQMGIIRRTGTYAGAQRCIRCASGQRG